MMILIKFHSLLCPFCRHFVFTQSVMAEGKTAWYCVVVRILQIALGEPLNGPIEHFLLNKRMPKSIINPSVFRMVFNQFAQEGYLELNVFGDHCVYQSCVLIILVDLHREFGPFLSMRVIKCLIAIDVGNALVSLVKSRIQVNRLPIAYFGFLVFFQFIKDVSEAEVELFAERILVEHVFIPILGTRYIFFESQAQSQSVIGISMYLAVLSRFFIPPFDSILKVTHLVLDITKPVKRILQTRIFLEKFLIMGNGAIKPIVQRTWL